MTRYLRTSTPAMTAASLLLMRCAGRAESARDRRDPVAYADARTSMDDARDALRAAVREHNPEFFRT